MNLALNTTDPDLWNLHYHNPDLAVELSANKELKLIQYSKEPTIVKLRQIRNIKRQLPTDHPSTCYYRKLIHKLEGQHFHIKRIYRTCGKSSFFVTLSLEDNEYSERQMIAFFTRLLHKLNQKLYGTKRKHLYLTGFVVFEGHTKFGYRCDKHFHAFFYAPTSDCLTVDKISSTIDMLISPAKPEMQSDSVQAINANPPPISDYQDRQIFDSVKVRQLGDSALRTIDYASKNLTHPEVVNSDPEYGLGLYEIKKGKLIRI